LAKRIVGAFLAVFMFVVFFSGCGINGSINDKKGDGKIVVGYSTPSLQNSFWVSVSEGMKAAAKEHNVSLLVRDATSDVARQAADIEDLIQQRVDAILISPYDSTSVVKAVNAVKKAGIPVVIVDIGISQNNYDSLVITDNILGGRLAGEWLVKHLGEKAGNAKVATIECQLGAENARERHAGFLQVMKENNIEVVAGQTADSLRDKAMKVMEDFLQKHPDLTAVFAECDDMALGALQAVKQAKADTIVIGFDGHPEAAKNIIEGSNLMADVAQQPEKMAKAAIEAAVKLVKQEQVAKKIVITPELVTKENAEKYIR